MGEQPAPTIVVAPIKDRRIIKSQIINTSGASADIVRQTFASGETLIVKRAKSPQNNSELDNEFRVLGDLRGVSPAIPAVYEEFKARGGPDVYSFQEEDLGAFKPLYDRGDREHPSIMLESLNTLEKIGVVEYSRQALAAAHSKGHAHGDLQLDNILVRKLPEDDSFGVDVKVTDWATSKTGITNMLKDVQQAAEVFEKILSMSTLIPNGFDQWIQKGLNQQFSNSATAWSELEAILKS